MTNKGDIYILEKSLKAQHRLLGFWFIFYISSLKDWMELFCKVGRFIFEGAKCFILC